MARFAKQWTTETDEQASGLSIEPFIHTYWCVTTQNTHTHTHTCKKLSFNIIKMKCLGFGSVQALWLGRLRYKERWQQAVNSKKTCFSYVPTQTSTSHNALRNHTELSQTALTSEEPLPTLALRPLSSSETVIIDCFFFPLPHVVVF